jgi:ATP synthase protein I
MSEDPRKAEENLIRQVGARQARMMRRRTQGASAYWSNFWQAAGMVGSIGWLVALPPLIGIAVGAWVDHRWPSRFSWTLMLLFGGLILGCAEAWNRIDREQRRR